MNFGNVIVNALYRFMTTMTPRPTQPSIPPGSVNEYQLRLGRQRQVWFIPLVDERGVCKWNCEIPWERVPYLSALEVCSRRGTIQIHVYLYLYLPLQCNWNRCREINFLDSSNKGCDILWNHIGIRHFFWSPKSDGYLKSDCGGYKIFVLVQLNKYFRK